MRDAAEKYVGDRGPEQRARDCELTLRHAKHFARERGKCPAVMAGEV